MAAPRVLRCNLRLDHAVLADAKHVVRIREAGVRQRITRLELDRTLKVLETAFQIVGRSPVPVEASLQIGLVRRGLRRLTARAVEQRQRQRLGDASGDRALNLEHAREVAVEGIGPRVRLVRDTNELRGDANHAGVAADAAFEHVIDVQRLSNLRDGRAGPLEVHRRRAADDAHARRIEPREVLPLRLSKGSTASMTRDRASAGVFPVVVDVDPQRHLSE
jgi:hypothetical protein